MFHSIMVVKIDKEKFDSIIAAASDLAEVTRTEPGCIAYNLLQPNGTDDTVIFMEVWEAPEDFEAHIANRNTEGTPLYGFGKVMMSASIGIPQHWTTKVLV